MLQLKNGFLKLISYIQSSKKALFWGFMSGLFFYLLAALIWKLLFPSDPLSSLSSSVAGSWCSFVGAALCVSNFHYRAQLEKRIKKDNGIVWTVGVNDIPVGTISDSVYATILLTINSDVKLYFAQLGNVCYIVIRVVNSLLYGLPIVVFWFVVSVAVLSPEDAKNFFFVSGLGFEVWRDASIFLLASSTLIFVLICCMCGMKFGYKNHFEHEKANVIRRYCKTPCEGNVTLFRQEEHQLQIA